MTTNINSYILGTSTVQNTNLHDNVFGSSVGTAVEGHTTLTINTSGDLSGGGTITLGTGGTLVVSYTGPTIPTNVSEFTNDSGYITSASIPTNVSSFTNDSAYITSASIPSNVSEFINDSAYITASAIPSNISSFTNDSAYITSASIPTAISSFTNDSAYITSASIPTNVSSFTNDSGYLTAHQDLSSYALTTQLFSGSYNDLTNTPTIPTVPTNVSAFTNDSGYLTSYTDTTYSTATSSTLGLVKIGYVESGKNYPVELSSGKMFVNVPWTDTDTNSDTTYTAGTGLTLTSTEFSVDSTIAPKTYVDTAISNLVNGANSSFDTLKEIQDAMATDTELATAIGNLSIPSNVSELTNDSGYITSYTDTNTVLSSASFSTANGVLTLTKSDASTVTVDLDGRFTDNTHADAMNQGVATTDSPSFVDVTATNFHGTSTYAKYADLAEKYTTNEEHVVGTVMMVSYNENYEASPATSGSYPIGVVSENPAFLMNDSITGQALALKGRVPVRVHGAIRKGEAVYVYENGVASNNYNGAALVGIALETNTSENEKLVECVIKI